ncbi:MAG: VWA domain-containing protein [Myxococcales bacterium]|nr:VWA domain-containing protein [Polyangiaceae bacterium]MDW8249638.1 VWA domain-containing protein [Myxococcales bacterium]
MKPLPLALALPYLAMAATAFALGALLLQGRPRGLTGRPALLAGLVLGWLPLLYVELVWMRAISERYLRVERPLWALLGAVVAAFVAFRLVSLSPRQHPTRRLLTELLLMGATLAASLATLGLELGRPLDRLTVIVAVDRSRSMDMVTGYEGRLRAEMSVVERGMKGEDRLGIVAFAAEARTEDPPRPKTATPSPQRVEIGRDATDLASAIRRSLAELPSDSAARIVLLSDGVATRGDALQAAAAAVAAGVPVDVIPLDQRKIPDVRVVSLRMPPRASEKEPIELRLVTASEVETEVEVRLKRDGLLLRKATARIARGEDVLRIKEVAPGPGFHRYDVEITALNPEADLAPEDNSGSAFLRVRGSSAALVLEGDPGKGAFVAKALEDAGFQVETGGTSRVPSDLAGLAVYDLVVFSDIRAADIAPGQVEALASYTRDLGGGLLLLGGDRSMGPGGYARTSLEEVSPVSFDLKQERRRASLSEVISIDYSGSMSAMVGAYTKLDLANEAAARSALLLGGSDRLGVAHVDTANAWTIPLGPVVDHGEIARKIKAVKVGGGGILVDLAMDEGYKALDREQTNLKHFLLFADGGDAEQMGGCRAKVTAALSRGITTSVVSLGKGADTPELEVLAKLGGGRFYLVEDASRLPAIFTQETILASRSAIHETDFRPSLGAPGAALRGIDPREMPILHGYVVTVAKARASVHLVGPEGDPILATWSVGVGRSAAFTSDLKDRWGVAWTSWPGASRLVGQLGRDIARRADDPRVRLEADTAGGELHLRATVVGDDGRAQSFRRLAARVGGPEGFQREIPLEPVGAGAYTATVPLSRSGTYIATAVDEVSHEVVGTTGAVLSAGEELRPTGTDRVLLGRIATMTGGKVRETLAGIFLDRSSLRFSYTPLTGPLALLSACAALLSVAARKLSLPEFLTAPRRPRLSPTVEIEPSSAPRATVLALRQAKVRASIPRAVEPVVIPRREAPVAPVSAVRPTPSSGDEMPTATPPAPAPPAVRQPTAAELLVARRKNKQG